MTRIITSIAIAITAALTIAATPEQQIADAAAALGTNRIAVDPKSDQGQILLRLALALNPEQQTALMTRELIARSATIGPMVTTVTERQLCIAMLKRADQLIDMDAAGDTENRLALLYVRACETYAEDNRAVIAALVRLKARGFEESLDALLTTPPASPRPSHVPADAVEWHGHYYRVDSGATSWAHAAAKAAKMRGMLACIETKEEHEFINQLCGDQDTYIGGVRIGDGWYWTNGGKVGDAVPWGPGQPNNFAFEFWMVLQPNRGVADVPIEWRSDRYVCEWIPEPASTDPAAALRHLYQLGAQHNGGSRYKLFPAALTWEHARLACLSMGGHLAIADSAATNTFLDRLRGKTSDIWLGASDADKEDDWRWVDGSPVRWTNWGKHPRSGQQPDNAKGAENYLHMWEDGTWNDYFGTSRIPFVCEWPE